MRTDIDAKMTLIEYRCRNPFCGNDFGSLIERNISTTISDLRENLQVSLFAVHFSFKRREGVVD